MACRIRVVAAKCVKNLILMLDAFGQSLNDAVAVVRTPNQVERVKGNHDALERLLQVSISGKLPDLFSEVQMNIEEPFEVFCFRL